jgi:pilus assembly protein CpaE
MPRKALIVDGAAGPHDVVTDVLTRFGFGTAEELPSLDAALKRLHGEHFDIVIVPVQEAESLQLAALEREIRSGRSSFVIGTAPSADPQLILRAMRAGIQEFLVFPPEPKDLASAIDRLVRRSHSEHARGQVIAVYSSKGGLGNTSIAVNLSYGFARNRPESRVAVVDLVVADGDVRVLLNLRPAYDMGDLVRKLDRVDAELLNSLLTPCAGGVWALPGPDSPEADEILDATTLGTIVEHLRANFAVTVLDCEHHLSERTLTALDSADRILLVTQLSVAALRSTQRTLTLCRRLGYPDEKLCVVINRYQSGEVLSLNDATEVLKTEIFWKLPNDYRTSAAAQTKGVPVGQLSGESKLAWSYAQMAAKLGGTSAELGGNGAEAARTSSSRLKQMFGITKKGAR